MLLENEEDEACSAVAALVAREIMISCKGERGVVSGER